MVVILQWVTSQSNLRLIWELWYDLHSYQSLTLVLLPELHNIYYCRMYSTWAMGQGITWGPRNPNSIPALFMDYIWFNSVGPTSESICELPSLPVYLKKVYTCDHIPSKSLMFELITIWRNAEGSPPPVSLERSDEGLSNCVECKQLCKKRL